VGSYRLTPAAQRDLSSIWDYTVERWDAGQAETYVLEIRNAIERRYAIGSHLIFFLEGDNGIDVIRILHQRMDPTRHL